MAVHVRNGGFYYDDWAVLALGRFPLPGGLLHGIWLNYGQRPGQVLYYAALQRAFGLSAGPRLANYGTSYLVDLGARRAIGLTSRAQCLAVA